MKNQDTTKEHTFDPDDWRWSAYVLNELEDDERQAMEAILERSEDARGFVAGLQGAATSLETELTAEVSEATGLNEAQRQAVQQSTAGVSSTRRSWWLRGGLIAAGLTIGSAIGITILSTQTDLFVKSREDAQIEQGATPFTYANYGDEKNVTGASVQELESLRAMGYTAGSVAPQANPTAFSRARARYEERMSNIADLIESDREAYGRIDENAFKLSRDEPLSTISIDVDTAAYSNMRRFLMQGQRPPQDAVRIEELINYFAYEDPTPVDGRPFKATLEVAPCPWNLENRLVRVGIKGREIPNDDRPASNLVFLIDVSGSMQSPSKLQLLKKAMRLLVESLDERDRVAMVVYAGSSGVVLESTSCDEKAAIIDALEALEAGGSTHGSAGIQLAYEVAVKNLIPGGTNRVILCTDGDFNVGISDSGGLTRLIEEKAKTGVFLSILGFGMGNLQDDKLEQLSGKGNGNYAYIDDLLEAHKVLVREMGSTLLTIAKDVKIQIEFNPAKVGAYRLIGYENRLLAARDFNDDTKDAGEIGAGHSLTVLYELVPAGKEGNLPSVDPLKYLKQNPDLTPAASGNELLTLKLRYKEPTETTSQLIEMPLEDTDRRFDDASRDLRFSAAVAAFGMILRDSAHKGTATLQTVHELAADAIETDPHGDRAGFLDLVRRAMSLQ